MVLESTIICVDNSEYMRNGDFIPTRLQAQQDAVGVVCQSKTQSNPENNVGLLTLGGPHVLNTLTTDVARLLSKLHEVQPKGSINFITGVRVAHLVLKHRQGKNHRMRIVVFVGSPIETETKDLVALAKSLKKEKVSVDVVNFGEADANTEKLATFISTLNGEEGSGSHLVTVTTGRETHLSDALVSSAVVQGEDGVVASGSGGFEFGIDPNEDPELILALRVSMEEQRQRQESEARRAAADAAPGKQSEAPPTDTDVPPASSEERLLERAMAMSMETEPPPPAAKATPSSSFPDFAAMTEEEQIAFAMQMSIQQAKSSENTAGQQSVTTDPADGKKEEPKKEEQANKEGTDKKDGTDKNEEADKKDAEKK
nr:26S proteasome non-ATPase regulatory subunit 4-like [Dermacentor andersoni]